MSDTEATPAKVTKPLGGIKEGNFAGMPQQDVDFLVACLKSSVGGSIVVNTIKVAELLEYKNHRSVTNRIKQMKDKYGLFMSGSTKVSVEPTEGDEEDAAEETPAKLMTPKAAAKPKAVKTPASSGKKQPAKAKAPVAKKRKIEEVEFPGLEPNGDADAASSAIEEEA